MDARCSSCLPWQCEESALSCSSRSSSCPRTTTSASLLCSSRFLSSLPSSTLASSLNSFVHRREHLHWVAHVRGGIKRSSGSTTTTTTATAMSEKDDGRELSPTEVSNGKVRGRTDKGTLGVGTQTASPQSTRRALSPSAPSGPAADGDTAKKEVDEGTRGKEGAGVAEEKGGATDAASDREVGRVRGLEPGRKGDSARSAQTRGDALSGEKGGQTAGDKQNRRSRKGGVREAGRSEAREAGASLSDTEATKMAASLPAPRPPPRPPRRRAPKPPPPAPEPPLSPLEESLLQTAAGRMTLAMGLVLRELAQVYVLQLYLLVAVVMRVLLRYTTLLHRLGLVGDVRRPERERRGRPEGRESGVVMDLEDEEDEAEILSAENLMPAPVERFKRVSAAFLMRHGLIDTEAERDTTGGWGEGGREGGKGEGGPSFTFSFTPSDMAAGKRGSTTLKSPAMLRGNRGLGGGLAALKKGGREEGRRKTRGREGRTATSPSAWKQLVPDVAEGAQVLSKSWTSLTKGLRKGILGSEKQGRIKLPPRRRVLFEDDDEDEDEEGDDGRGEAWPNGRGSVRDRTGLAPRTDRIGVPPRARRLSPPGEEAGQQAHRLPRQTEAGQRTASGRTSEVRAEGLPAPAPEDEDGDEDWLASLQRRGEADKKTSPLSSDSVASRRRRGKPRDDIVEDGPLRSRKNGISVRKHAPVDSSSTVSSSLNPFASSTSSLSLKAAPRPSSRAPRERFVRGIEDVAGGKFAGAGDARAQAREKVDELRRKTAMSWSVRKNMADRQRKQGRDE
ncbi:hypothetical protein NSK_001389 [Nannochloropsis salina CCMP1776]|uniref:Uncharacterized protein n=1 Tax=Nannochloropsis salina CCMP1776 TaxID=1027361 RepID=A0A4D9DC43_9STRA|nr:hypothetical protein NSK_001389 [Nannochloropsis salina CCMP1776]|eukprot:TFJ87055.1 hypothetical protein NSK_001389 [Nannochloropsis salina CCMP1776]